MSGQMEIGDQEKIEDRQRAEREEARAARARDLYPVPLPKLSGGSW